jgi:DNA polymerase elongation subunit (family B)
MIDIRVAELMSAYGRFTLRKMQNIALSLGFEVVGGHIDSLFLNGGGDSSIQELIMNI